MTSAFSSLFKKTNKGLTLRIKITPRARVSEVTSLQDDETSSSLRLFQEKILKISLKEPPEKGRANAALLKLLSRTWKIPKTSLHLMTGETSSLKVLLITGDPEELQKTLENWMAETCL